MARIQQEEGMDIGNPGHLKIALLVQGMEITEEAKEGLGSRYMEKLYSYSLTDKVDRKVLLPSDIKLDNVFVGFRFNGESEWGIEADGERRILTSKGEAVKEASFIPRPVYYGMVSSGGKPLRFIGVSCGNHGISFFINSYCEYFSRDENCKFCGLLQTQKKFSDTIKLKKVDQVEETANIVLDSGEQVDFFQLSGGSMYDHNMENRKYLPYIRVIRGALERRGLAGVVPIHLTCMPPMNLDILKELKESGLDTISFDLECTNPEYFERYCPGKARTTGYSEMKKALREARKVFGDGNAYTIVIAGLEPREAFIRGLGDVMDDGIVPTINIFHNDPYCSPEIGDPDSEELIDTAYDSAVLFRKHGVMPGSLGCAHYDIGHEIRKGYFDA